jgi:hypothetical protein
MLIVSPVLVKFDYQFCSVYQDPFLYQEISGRTTETFAFIDIGHLSILDVDDQVKIQTRAGTAEPITAALVVTNKFIANAFADFQLGITSSNELIKSQAELLDKNIFFKVLIGVFFIKQVVDHINIKIFDKMDNGICMGFYVVEGGFILFHIFKFI